MHDTLARTLSAMFLLLLSAGPTAAQAPEAPPKVPKPPATAPALAPDFALGQAGESCRARRDCAAGLRCVAHTCRHPDEGTSCTTNRECPPALRCREQHCENPWSVGEGDRSRTEPEKATPPADRHWPAFRLEGVHGFAGLTFGPGMSKAWTGSARSSSEIETAIIFGLRGGVTFGRFEIALELSPVSFVPFLAAGDALLSMNLTTGGYLPLSHRPGSSFSLHWPLRTGFGFIAVNIDPAMCQARLDLVGLAFQYGHLFFEVSLPSLRYYTEFSKQHFLSAMFNLSAAYFF